VHANDDGAAIAGAVVKLFSRDPHFADETEEAATGRFGTLRIDAITGLPRTGLCAAVAADGFATQLLEELEVPRGERTLELRCALAGSVELRGHVVDAASGRPIADADVELVSLDTEIFDAGAETTSEPDGSFTIAAAELPANATLVYARAAGYQSLRIDRPWPSKGKLSDLRVALTPAIRWHGRITDAASGAPVTSGEVHLRAAAIPSDVAEEHEDAAPIAEDGAFNLPIESAPAGGPVELIVTAPGFVNLRRRFEALTAMPSETLEFALERAVVVRGHVIRSADGEPVAGALVRAVVPGDRARDAEADRAAVTGRDGSWLLEIPARRAIGTSLVVELLRRHFGCGRLVGDGTTGEIVVDLTIDVPAQTPRGTRRW
jgi:hypothetical protein